MACSRWARLVANRQYPSTRGDTIPALLTLALLSTASVTDTPEIRISAVAASPKNKDDLAVAREALEPALAKAFADTTFSPEQVVQVIDLCAKYRPVVSLSADELGSCIIPKLHSRYNQALV